MSRAVWSLLPGRLRIDAWSLLPRKASRHGMRSPGACSPGRRGGVIPGACTSLQPSPCKVVVCEELSHGTNILTVHRQSRPLCIIKLVIAQRVAELPALEELEQPRRGASGLHRQGTLSGLALEKPLRVPLTPGRQPRVATHLRRNCTGPNTYVRAARSCACPWRRRAVRSSADCRGNPVRSSSAARSRPTNRRRWSRECPVVVAHLAYLADQPSRRDGVCSMQ